MKELLFKTIERAYGLSDSQLANPQTPQELVESFDLTLSESGYEGDKEQLVDEIFSKSINTQNPRFMNQLFGASTQEAWLGELITAIMNTSMATYEIAPLATMMEKEIIAKISEEVGYQESLGIMTPGGSYANMLGIHCARFWKNPEVKKQGFLAGSHHKVFISSDAHYSSEKSVDLLGIGTDNLVRVKTDDQHKMDLEDLENKIKDCLERDEVPLCVVSTAATTVWGSYDPISEINEICQKYKIWHHVDAAWGGLALWSKYSKQRFKGVSEVDSITFDFHKLMASTLTKGIFITKHPEVLKGANAGGGKKYIFHNIESPDTGPYAQQCGRKVDSLPVWLQWKLRGTEHYRNKVNELYSLQEWFVEKLMSSKEQYKVLTKPEFMNICFQLKPSKTDIDTSLMNKRSREVLMNRGNFMVNFSSDEQNGYFFRLVLNHWQLNQQILEELLDELSQVQKIVEKEMS